MLEPLHSRPLRRVLVANRGEIAVRILRTLNRLGYESVLAVSAADRESLGTRLAGRTVCIGPARSGESYLRIDTLIHAALATGCQAVHPGYGFLSERAEFARACEDNDLVFIGPSSAHIASVGDKLEARLLAERAGVPITPGGAVSTLEEALGLAQELGYPVLIKAVGGGGGRGLKRADDPEKLAELFELASAEALAAFGDERIYIERFVTRGRHVEVQVLGDGKTVIHLGDRDCSVQRRYQKLLEEAPAPLLPEALRRDLHDAAVRFAQSIAYRSLGTVEFLVDVDRESFYFLEMNARIQVEHPVTEMITGIDLVELQLQVAEGQPLNLAQDQVVFNGHAIECRLNAEDPDNGFQPSPGRVQQVVFPQGEGIRIDTHLESGAVISPYYDSMLAKMVAWGKTREEARLRMLDALSRLQLSGIRTNQQLHGHVLSTQAFAQGGVDTGFLAHLFLQRA